MPNAEKPLMLASTIITTIFLILVIFKEQLNFMVKENKDIFVAMGISCLFLLNAIILIIIINSIENLVHRSIREHVYVKHEQSIAECKIVKRQAKKDRVYSYVVEYQEQKLEIEDTYINDKYDIGENIWVEVWTNPFTKSIRLKYTS